VVVPAEQAVHAPPEDRVTDDIADFAEAYLRLMRMSRRARQQFLAAAKHNVEWAASVIISCVANDGPLRASALAEIVQSDPSTISRQVAALVRDGLLERRADPVDGRASLLVTTAKGDAAHREQIGMRNQHFAGMLDDWTERDIRRFTALLRRFTDDYEKHLPRFFADRGQPNAEES
jgi:DNA-binding MarR family transcriptional regulator